MVFVPSKWATQSIDALGRMPGIVAPFTFTALALSRALLMMVIASGSTASSGAGRTSAASFAAIPACCPNCPR